MKYRSRTVGTLFRPAFVALVIPVVLIELLGRILLADTFVPLAFVFAPPVLGAVLFTLLRPAITAALEGERVRTADLRAGSVRRSVAAGIGSVAVHGVALAVGVAGFVLVDTPVRFLWYWSGGDTLSIGTMALLGICGVLAGVVAVWGLLADVIVRIGDGDPVVASLRDATWTHLRSPKAAAVAAGVHLLVAGTVVVAAWAVLVVPNRLSGPWTVLAAVGILIVDGAALLAFALERADRPLETPPTDRKSIVRVAVAVALVTSLVVGASAVRLTETRPMDAEPEPLPDDPTAAYATALENTERKSVSIDLEHRGEPLFYESVRADRGNRRLRVTFTEPMPGIGWGYWSAGTAAPVTSSPKPDLLLGSRSERRGPFDYGSVVAVPGYWSDADPGPVQTVLPDAGTGEWRTVDRDGDELTLELTDVEAVAPAIYGESVEPIDGDVETARVRVTVDTDRGVVTGGAKRLHVDAAESESVWGDVDVDTAFEVETGATVDRPAELESPTASEWFWKLVAY